MFTLSLSLYEPSLLLSNFFCLTLKIFVFLPEKVSSLPVSPSPIQNLLPSLPYCEYFRLSSFKRPFPGKMGKTHEPLPQSEEQAVAKEEERGQWSGQFDFLMSMIAYAVGLGNVWRFPYLCYKNGGGSFLAAYSVFFVLAAVPIFIMEVTIGQYLQRGAMEMWNMCPLWKGLL